MHWTEADYFFETLKTILSEINMNWDGKEILNQKCLK